jgi:signal transduction histidine kinase
MNRSPGLPPGPIETDQTPVQSPHGTATDSIDAFEREQDHRRAIAEARQARDRALALEERARFLAESSRVLAASLDLEQIFRSIARLAVPMLGDWCIVDTMDDTGHARPVAVAAADPTATAIASRLEQTLPLSRSLRTCADADRRAILREIDVRAELRILLVARERTLGALTLLGTTPGQVYTEEDRELAGEFAQRAAVAIDNALLYREAERANSAKAQFLATMSHEFRTPLQTVMGFTDLLLMGRPVPIPDAARVYAERISAASSHLLALIDQVLDFARLDAGHDSMHPEPLDIALFAGEMLSLVEPLAVAKGLDFTVQAPPVGTVMVTDVGKLRQVCYNLLANAVKFTEHGSIMLAACAQNGRMVIEVRDTGVGIHPADLAHIFEAFYQVDRPIGGPQAGTGLGLTISRHLVRLLGGELRATSEVGKGTTFTILLPLVPSPTAAGS